MSHRVALTALALALVAVVSPAATAVHEVDGADGVVGADDAATAASAEEPASDAAATSSPSEDTPFPLGATIVWENAVGRGTFIGDPAVRQPLWNMYLSLRPAFRFDDPPIVLQLRLDLDVNLVEDAGSTSNHPHQMRVGDLTFTVTWDDLVLYEPAAVQVTPTVTIVFPTSLLSRLMTKAFGLRLGVDIEASPVAWLGLDVRARATKNFNTYTNAVLKDDDFSAPPVSRAGGAEALAAGRTATTIGATSWEVVWGASVEGRPVAGLSVLVDFEMAHLFSYHRIPVDRWSSPYAQPGRGQSDLMYGTIELAYEVNEHLTLALGTVVEQTPKTADNRRFRFPFWDTTNGADNGQVFYLDVTGTL